MTLSRSLTRVVVGEHHCRVLVEVPDLDPGAWRRLTADPTLSWRRIGAPRAGAAPDAPSGAPVERRAGTAVGPRAGAPVPLRRRRGKVEAPVRRDRPAGRDPSAPVPALLEVTGSATGVATVAQRRLAVRALSRLRAAGLTGEVVGTGPADAPACAPPSVRVWPAGRRATLWAPAEQDELDRRFALLAAAWPGLSGRSPRVGAPDEARVRARVDGAAALCLLPLLLMVVPTAGPWWDSRRWVLVLTAATVCVGLPLLVVHHLAERRRFFGSVRRRILVAAPALLLMLLLTRVLVAVPVPPLVVAAAAGLALAVATPVALRTVPALGTEPGARLAVLAVPAMLVLAAVPVGELLVENYLAPLGLRPADVTLTVAQRWLSGALFGLCALAAAVVAVATWGWAHRSDGSERLRRPPPAPVLAVLGVVLVAGLFAACAAVAGNRAAPDRGGLPGSWIGVTPTWVCWSVPGGPAGAPFVGRALPPAGQATVWLGGASGRQTLWSPESGGVTIADPVRLLLRDGPGPCP